MAKKPAYHNRRYYLHRIIKEKYALDVDKREITVPYQSFAAIPVPDRYYIGQLIKLGYNVQMELF